LLRWLQDRLQALLPRSDASKAEAILSKFDASIQDLETVSNELRVAIARSRSELDAADSEVSIEAATIERLRREPSREDLDEAAGSQLRESIGKRDDHRLRVERRKSGIIAHLKLLESGLKELTSELGRLKNNRSLLGERLTLASARQKLYRARGGIGQTSRWELERELSSLVREAELTAESMRDLLRSHRRE
jgi:hypothetical protein